MAFFLKGLFSIFQVYPTSDLGEEQIEEYRLLSGFKPRQIHKYRLKFLKYVENPEYITREEFMNIPTIKDCPLLDRLATVFGFDEDKTTISFFEYIKVLYRFNGETERQNKIDLLFRLHDYDDDGRLSRFDLIQFLKAVIEYKSESIDMEYVADSILQEFDGTIAIDIDQFSKIFGMSQDFHTRLILPL